MRRLRSQIRILAATSTIVAGYVDAVGFLSRGGFFVSFMRGNTTRLGVGFVTYAYDGKVAVGLIFLFVMGVTLDSPLVVYVGRHRRSVVLALVAAFLACAVVVHSAGSTRRFAAVALAMGVKNELCKPQGEIAFPTLLKDQVPNSSISGFLYKYLVSQVISSTSGRIVAVRLHNHACSLAIRSGSPSIHQARRSGDQRYPAAFSASLQSNGARVA